MDRISSWLCPTEHHRARALEANARVRTARTMAGATCGLSLLAMAPFVGWWFLVLFGASAAVMVTRRPAHRAVRPARAGDRAQWPGDPRRARGGRRAQRWRGQPRASLAGPAGGARRRPASGPQVVIVGAAITAAAMAGGLRRRRRPGRRGRPDSPDLDADAPDRGHRRHDRPDGGRAGASRPRRARPAHRPPEPGLARRARARDRGAGAPHRRRRLADPAGPRLLQGA